MKNVFSINIIPDNDVERAEAVKRYCIFNTPAEPSFTNIAELARTIFKTAMAHISFMSEDEEFVKASVGLGDVVRVGRGESVCALTVLTGELTVIEDALKEPILDQHPYVHGPFGLRFYAGAPLISPDGYVIGTMCVIDQKPRSFSEHDREILKGLAKVAMEQTELRLATLREIEKQQSINHQLSLSEQRLQSILDTMAEGVGITDAGGNLVYANAMAERTLGIEQSKIKERTYYDAKWQNLRVDGTPLPPEEHPMSLMMSSRTPLYDQEIAVQPPNGERFYISINAAPLIDPETDELIGGIGTFMDVTKRRMLLQQREEFVSIASHELKTPVTSLKASLQLLDRIKDKFNHPQLNKVVNQTNKSLDKLIRLISDLLDANRISQGQWQIRKKKFPIGIMLKDCCHHVTTEGSHQLIFEGELDAEVIADEQQIDQVIVNLVNNAVRYAPNSKDIVVGVEKMDSFLKVSVSDEGPGVEPDKQAHLFERYYRADYSGVQFAGLGLGLYISKQIIEKHGGQMGLESEVGKGSTFWFTLPLG